MAALHHIQLDGEKVKSEFGHAYLSVQQIMLAANKNGMFAKHVVQDITRLQHAPVPAIACARDGSFFIMGRMLNDAPPAKTQDAAAPPFSTAKAPRFLIQRKDKPPEVISEQDFFELWDGSFIFITSKATFAEGLGKFDFTWFVPVVVKYRRILLEVLLISVILQIIGLITPMFFQVVMDKVLVNNAMKTLDVMAVALLIAIVFEAALSGIRSLVFASVSSKIDVELGAKLFRHLLGLPIAYFNARRVGDSVARVREVESIRSFLTGNAMTVLLDAVFGVIFLSVMFYYSKFLTLIVCLSIPVYVLISVFFTPVIRSRLNDKFAKGAENQSFLVESISGIDTIKSLAVEDHWFRTWDKQLAAYVRSGLSVSNASTIASTLVNLTSKLVTAAIMWFGASLVIDRKLTVGELVAFNMLANQVSGPILRLAQLWNDFQQVGISMSRLGDILNSFTEVSGQKSRLPSLTGSIRFDAVFFRYKPDASDVLSKVDFTVEPGEVIGIVGRSGSGKSTLTKLVQRLYVPTHGRVLVDGQDLAIVDTSSLRRQIGVVLQENTLFNRSIRDNIALTMPNAPMEAIIRASKLAGAHEFICELPEAYDTMVGEHGVGLSGGQRQRLAIARALISNPKILIFDEATSALDYESEKIIRENMKQISAGRTVLIIAHRLSAVRDANRIVVMDRGQLVESGSHDELIQDPKGLYRHLFDLQQG